MHLPTTTTKCVHVQPLFPAYTRSRCPCTGITNNENITIKWMWFNKNCLYLFIYLLRIHITHFNCNCCVSGSGSLTPFSWVLKLISNKSSNVFYANTTLHGKKHKENTLTGIEWNLNSRRSTESLNSSEHAHKLFDVRSISFIWEEFLIWEDVIFRLTE